jgi:hypothetical protein
VSGSLINSKNTGRICARWRIACSGRRDLRQQRRVVDAFLAAVREGNFERLVALLDPDIVLRADGGARASASDVPTADN